MNWVKSKDTTTTLVMLFWCLTYFEQSNFKHILHTLFYCFYFWLWRGSCPLDLRSYSFKIKLLSLSLWKSLPYWAGKICQTTSLHPYSILFSYFLLQIIPCSDHEQFFKTFLCFLCNTPYLFEGSFIRFLW